MYKFEANIVKYKVQLLQFKHRMEVKSTPEWARSIFEDTICFLLGPYVFTY